MTLQEKYDLALACLRKLAQMGMDGADGRFCMDSSDVPFYDGLDAGLSRAGDVAEACLHNLGETLK